MIEELGKVVAIEASAEGQVIVVETEIKTTCNACQVQSSCGTSAIAKALNPKKQALRFAHQGQVELGQSIKIGIPEERLLSASALVYLLPLVGLIGGAMLAQWLAPALGGQSELWQVLCGGALAAMAFYTVKQFLNGRAQQHYCPQLLEVISPPAQAINIRQL